MDFSRFAINPDYGTGVYRRAVRLSSRPGEIHGELEDPVHAIRCRARHDSSVLTHIEAEFVRWPVSTCPASVLPVKALEGTRLGVPVADLFAGGAARRNCTHIYDLMVAMLLHSRRDDAVRRYDVLVPDHDAEARSTATLLCNGAVLLEWCISPEGEILSPEPYAGKRVIQGFSRWATNALEDDALDAALILQKGYWQSPGRRFLVGKDRAPVRDQEQSMKGACFTFSSPQFEKAHRIYSWRDFPAGVGLLEFEDFSPDG